MTPSRLQGTARINLPRPHPAQARIIAHASRYNVVACGRRFGKSVLGVDQLIRPALAGKPVAYFCPTYKMLTEVWRDVVRVLRPVIARTDVQQHRLELVTGGVVDMWSLDSPDGPRGRKYARVVIDEAAMVPSLEEAWERVIRPTLADLRGDAWFLSSPRGMNYFHTLYQRGQDPLRPTWRSWQMPSSANPHMPAGEIDDMAADMTAETYAQEILAQFVADGIGVFRHVAERAIAGGADPVGYHQYVMGVDWGRTNDYTVCCVIDATTRTQVALERFTDVEYAIQRDRIGALAERYRVDAIIAEANAMGAPVIEQLQRDDLPVYPFTTTNASKMAIIDALALALEQGTITLLDHPVQTAELLAYTSERLPSGLIRYGAPKGQHDDTVMALALAWHGASSHAGGQSLDPDIADALINYTGY